MSKNSYWLLAERGKRANKQLILELTPDGMAYMWPVKPDLQKTQLLEETDQDLDAFLTDGDFLDKKGFFHSLSDFANHSRYTTSLYDFTPIGEFESIRACRAAMV